MTPDEFMKLYETCTRTHGLDKTLSLIDEHAVYWFSDGTCHIGKEAISKAIRHNFQVIADEDYRISDIVWAVQSNEMAACTYKFEWSGVIQGNPASGAGRGTSVLARRGESWVVVHEHLSKGFHRS